ncbi:MAG: hypothetical protein RIN56_04035 [Sporomusaceae bacterium]|nr:hypothetical protein [Sporomusaceae bacterium]
MELVRISLWPIIIGFIFCLLLNPIVAGPGFIVWLALMYYVHKRGALPPEH